MARDITETSTKKLFVTKIFKIAIRFLYFSTQLDSIRSALFYRTFFNKKDISNCYCTSTEFVAEPYSYRT